MPTKPSETFTCATDANFSSGDAAGQPTKVNPPGFPNCAQGVGTPGAPAVPEYLHKLLNITGQWVSDWLNVGSAAGAEDAHLVETDATGLANLARLGVSILATITGKLLLSGANAGIRHRSDYATMVHTGPSTLTVAADTYFCTGVLAADRAVALSSTGATEGQRIRAVNTLGGGGGFELIFSREGSIELGRIEQNAATNQGGFIEFEFANGDWHAIACGGEAFIKDHGSPP